MTDSANKVISGAKEALECAKAQTDAAMLRSMATALVADLDFSFNREDMAELLRRQADKIEAEIPGHIREILPGSI